MKIKANGISMNYDIKGKGENLVLIHGAGDNCNMWYHQIPFFSQRYRVITYDIRGFGKSESPEGKEYRSLFTIDLYELMKVIGVQEAYFLGYSLGGRIAIELAINHPKMVRALMLVNTNLGLTSPSPETVERRRMILDLLDKGDAEKVTEIMTTYSFSPDFKSRNPAEFKKYMKVKLQNDIYGFARLTRSLGTPASPIEFNKIKCPVLIVVGKYDLLIGQEHTKQAQEAISGSKLVTLPTGHAAMIEMPDLFNSTILEFLSSVKD